MGVLPRGAGASRAVGPWLAQPRGAGGYVGVWVDILSSCVRVYRIDMTLVQSWRLKPRLAPQEFPAPRNAENRQRM